PSYTDMSVMSFLRFAADMRGLQGEARRAAIRRVVELCHLDGVLGQTIDTLSKGYRHRTCLAQAMVHDPEVLILDEPTDGLDPNQKHEVRSLIKRMGQEKAIIFSTHILEEVEAACTRALIIDQGKIVANGPPEELKAAAPLAGTLVVGIRNLSWAKLQTQLEPLTSLERAELVSQENSSVTARLHPKGTKGALLPELLDLAHHYNWSVEH